jgi:hypothetical protein
MRISLAWLLSPLLALGSLAASDVAEAQNLGIQLLGIHGPDGDRITEDLFVRGINLRDCENPTESYLTFGFPAGSATVTSLDIWLGVGAQRCESQDSRTPPTQTCDHIAFIPIGTSAGSAPPPTNNTDVTIGLDLLAGTEFYDNYCSANAAPTDLNFLFVADLNNFTGETSSLDSNDWTSVLVRANARPADAPRITSATAAGDRQITVEWSRVFKGQEVIQYKLYIEKDGCDPAAASGLLAPGERPPLEIPDDADIFVVDREVIDQSTSVSIVTSNIGLEVGESATVYVVSVDAARNESVLSEAICITRVPTAGFCQAWEDAEGEPCPSSCAAMGASPSSVLWLAGLLSLLFVAYRRRFAR